MGGDAVKGFPPQRPPPRSWPLRPVCLPGPGMGWPHGPLTPARAPGRWGARCPGAAFPAVSRPASPPPSPGRDGSIAEALPPRTWHLPRLRLPPPPPGLAGTGGGLHRLHTSATLSPGRGSSPRKLVGLGSSVWPSLYLLPLKWWRPSPASPVASYPVQAGSSLPLTYPSWQPQTRLFWATAVSLLTPPPGPCSPLL